MTEDKLWQSVTQSVKPLARDKRAHGTAIDGAAIKSDAPDKATKPKVKKPIAPQAQAPPKIIAKQGLPRHELRRLAKQNFASAARLDLHGLSRAEAEQKLHAFLTAAQERGQLYVLVITGKGEKGQGVLRRALPDWLGRPDYAGVVVGFDAARPNHGGAGAFYVRLKKRGG